MVARLRFVPAPPAPAPADDELVVVLDTTWIPRPDQRHPNVVGLRELAAAVMARRYLNADATALLNAWVEASDVVSAMTLEGVSFWYGARLGHWLWLVDQLLWINVLDDLLGRTLAYARSCSMPAPTRRWSRQRGSSASATG